MEMDNWNPPEFSLGADNSPDSSSGSAENEPIYTIGGLAKKFDISLRTLRFYESRGLLSPDRQGRVAIPQGLREFAGLERDVVVVGLYDHIEIWDAAAWRRTKQVGEQRLAAGDGASAPTS